MAVSIYEPRVMIRALKELKPANTLLRRLFFGAPPQTHDTKSFDVDIVTGVRRAAEFVNPNGVGKTVDRTGFSTHNFRPASVAPKRVITAGDLQTRLPGESIYDGVSPDERAGELFRGDLQELLDMIVRREEIMIRDALVTGQIVVTGEDVARTILFPARHSSLTIGTLAAAKRWDAGTSDPARDIREWRRKINAQTGLTADALLLGSDAADALLANSMVQKQLDVRRMEMGELAAEMRDGGATYYGRLNGVDLWGYDELDEAGNPLISAKTVLMGATTARCEMHYGPVAVTEGEGSSAKITLVRTDRLPDSWVEKEPPVRWVKISSNPVPVPIQNNGFATATVLG